MEGRLTKKFGAYALTNVNGTEYYNLEVYYKTVSSISVSTAPTKTSYNVGDLFDPSGLVITINYSDSTSNTFAYANHEDSFSFSPSLSTPLAVENTSVSISYGGKSVSQSISVSAVLTPYITPAKASTSGYTGQTETISFSCGNLSALSVVSNDPSIVTIGDVDAGASSGTAVLNFVGDGSTTVSFKNSGSELASLSVGVTQTTLSLNKASTSINLEDSETLVATTNVGGASWSSNNAKVSVASGVVTVAADAVVGSTATITATSDVDDSVSASCVVTVTAEHGRTQPDPLTVAEAITIGTALAHNTETTKDYYINGFIAAEGVSGGHPYYWLANGDNAQGFEIYYPAFADGINSSDCKVGAEVIIHCKIKKYSSTIETGSLKEIVSLTYAERPATAFSIIDETAILSVGGEITLNASITPVYTTDTVTWTSSSNSVATVSNGVVTGVSNGEATITATVRGFTDTCLVKVALDSTFDLTANSPISASTTQMKWVVSNKVSMTLDKNTSSTNANNYYPGTAGQTYTSTRFYKNQILTVAPDKTIIAYKAEFLATTANYANKLAASSFTNATAAVSPTNDKLVIVTFTNGLNQFAATISDTCGFESAKIYYRDATAAEIIVRTETRSSLAYQYNTEPLEIMAAAIRFGGMVSETLWNSLNTAQTIQGYGTLLSTATYVSANGGQLSALYNSADGSNVKKFDHAVATMPDEANAAQKGELVGTYYIWNLFKNVALDALTTEYVCVAYIRTVSGVVFFEQAVASVDGLADAMLEGPDYNDSSYDGSLKCLSDLN